VFTVFRGVYPLAVKEHVLTAEPAYTGDCGFTLRPRYKITVGEAGFAPTTQLRAPAVRIGKAVVVVSKRPPARNNLCMGLHAARVFVLSNSRKNEHTFLNFFLRAGTQACLSKAKAPGGVSTPEAFM